jgi:ABC-type uncharacterized transport system involved in gliding motility auxiliary subunit
VGLFIIGLAVYAALDPGAIRTAITGRHAKYGSNALILGIAFLGILFVINYLVFKYNKQWDLTADKSNTLAKETTDILKSLPNPVVAKAFFTSDSNIASSKDSAKTLLDKYVHAGTGKFEYQFIDPNKDPVASKDAGITKDGTIVLYMGDAKQPVTVVSEQEITGAMVRLMNPGTHVIYFLTGHGEYPTDASGDQSYSQLKTDLESKNYTVSSLNLLVNPQIPNDASVIVIAGPQKPLNDSEVTLLDGYLKNGGSLVVMEEPTVVTQFGDSPDPLADYLSKTIGIVLGNDVVVDVRAAQSMQQPFIAISDQFADHPITQNMNNMVALFPTARSVISNDATGSDYTKTQLVLTASQSWAETDMASIQNNSMQPDQGVDKFGPVSLAVAAQGATNNARLVVFGDSDFASNTNYFAYGNGNLIVNSIDWAAKVENLINLTPKTTVQRQLKQPQTNTMGLLLLTSFIILPGIILIAGVVVWIRRRRQG